MKKIAFIVFLIVTFFFTACNKNNSGTLAKIGNQVLTEQDLSFQGSEIVNKDQKNRYIKEWVETQLLYNEALRLGYSEDKFIKKEIERIRKKLLIENLLNDVIDKKIEITETEIKDFYDAHIELFIYPETLYRVVIIETTSAATRNKIREKIKDNNDLSTVFSDTTLSPKIIDKGDYFLNENAIPGSIRSRVQQLKVGKLINGIKSGNSYFFAQLLSKREKGNPAPLQEVRNEIEQQMYFIKRKQMYNRLIADLRSREFIEINFTTDDSVKATE